MKVIKIFLFIASVLLVSNSIVLVRDYIKTPKNIKHFLFKEGDILEGVSTGPSEITVDFSKQISTGSPLIFGGVHAPGLNHEDAWNKLAEIGVTSLRTDFFIQWEVSNNITYQNYLENKNNIRDVSKWNTTFINQRNSIYKNAKDRGMKTIAILSYAPRWLTYSNTYYGVPRDWEMYEDIVKRAYKIHRNNIDYLEIWNEPDWNFFLDTANSGLSREEAYENIFLHAVKAIREVDNEINDGRKISIGAPVISKPTNTKILERIMSNPNIRDRIDFVSFHSYGIDEVNYDEILKILKKNGKQKLPIFITEWNAIADEKKPDPILISNKAIVFTGKKFIEFLQKNIRGANYFSLNYVNPNSNTIGEGYLAIYYWDKNKAILLPQAKTWRLLSKSMGLGKGESKIFESTGTTPSTLLPFFNDEMPSIGFENIDSVKGMALVNDSDSEKYVHVVFNDIGKEKMQLGKTFLDVYIASADYDGGKPVDRIYLKQDKDNTVSFTLLLPPQSVAGIIQPQETDWRELIKTYIP